MTNDKKIEPVFRVGDKIFKNEKEAKIFVKNNKARTAKYKLALSKLKNIKDLSQADVIIYIPIAGMKIKTIHYLWLTDGAIESQFDNAELLDKNGKNKLLVNLIESGMDNGYESFEEKLMNDDDFNKRLEGHKIYKKFKKLVNEFNILYKQLSQYEQELIDEEKD